MKAVFHAIAAAVMLCMTTAACTSVDDTRIPLLPVKVEFKTEGEWNVYGVSGALDWCLFIRDGHVYRRSTGATPAFPFLAGTYTGFGGVLLVADFYGNPVAYDLSCPVECAPTVRVAVDANTHRAVCPKCGSSYDIYENYGHPASGPAAEHGYGLRRYVVMQSAGSYRTVTR